MSEQTRIFDGILYGGDYNPDQWLDRPGILRRDIELMQRAHINVVTLGVFSWSSLEPQEGVYHLSWLRGIVDDLHENGIAVIMATPSGARPRWLAEKYPEVLRVREDRTRELFGERHNHCYTSPVYREKVRAVNRRLAEEFADHPAVILWHISNEYGGECHCDLCQDAFRTWLEERYDDIDELNAAWWTAFWSHTYDSFEQVESPSSIGESGLLALSLDWKRFVTKQTADFMREEIKALRDAGAKQPVTTNFMRDYTGLDYWQLAQHVDYVSWDSYPRWHCGNDHSEAYDTAMQHDLMRSLKHRPFLLMESSPSAVNWHGVSRLKRPGVVMTSCLQAVAHGADSAQFFQIRQGRGGYEKFHGAVIDHYGEEDTRVFREVADTGRVLESLAAVAGAKIDARAALVYDTESRWAMELSRGPRNDGLYYHETVLKNYEALCRCGLNVDVVNVEQSLDDYAVAAVPMLYMFRPGVEDKLRRYVEDGGTLVLTYWSGIVGDSDLAFLGGTPHGLMDVVGLRSEEIDGLPDGETNTLMPVLPGAPGLQGIYTCEHLCELVRLNGAQPLLVYGRDFYKGYPALTVNEYGAGRAYYVCADAEQKLYNDLYRTIADDCGLEPILPGQPDDVIVSCRRDAEADYIFAYNFADTARRIRVPDGCSVLYGQSDGTIAAYSALVLERARVQETSKEDAARDAERETTADAALREDGAPGPEETETSATP